MPDVVGIRFKSCGKIYDFEVNGFELKKGDSVVVESELGLSIGNVVIERHPLERPPKELKKVLRKAAEEDLRQKTENETLEADAKAYCLERIMARGLPMKLICTEVTLDRKRIIFYFAAEGRIDFRELVKDLAARFKTRIEMRQIGVRDEAKMLGGLGICGRELCCKKFLTTFEPISIKMAKSQELVLNANKLSGVCGRLMCCLSYEYSEGEEQPAGDERVAPAAKVAETAVENVGEKASSSSLEVIGEITGTSVDNTTGGQERPQGFVAPSVKSGEHTSGQMVEGMKPGEPAEAAGKTETAGEATPAAQGGEEGEKRFHRRRRRRRRRHRK